MKNILYFTIGFLLIMTACSKSEIDTWDARPRVWFTNSNDTTLFSFYTQPEGTTESVVEVPISMAGRVADEDRTVTVKDLGSSPFNPGSRYEIVSAVIPAGEVTGMLQVKVYKTENLEEANDTLNFEICGSSVYQQTLNLTISEKQELRRLLEENYLPENRVYRYNFFYDNCTTRARDVIERCIEGKVVYSEGKEGLSFRDIVHQYTKGHKWDELGIDMCLGSEADKPIDARKQMFAPFYLLEAAKKATIVVGDSVRPLILHEKKVVDAEPENVGDGFPLSPLACVFILIGITCFVGWLQFKTRKIIWIWDLLLFGVQGLAGCVITFLVFFSTHPTVGSNWLILLLNPIPLLYLPVMVCRAIKGKKDLYHTINVVYLTLFIMIMPFVQQKFNVTVLPLALCLLICSANHVLLYYRQNNK